ncbi:MAG: hypothetical protein OEM52_15140, partial [bacterium]|nr:hypothetical protein [bacterium]
MANTLTIPLLVLIPMFSGVVALMIRQDHARRILLITSAVVHLILTLTSYGAPAVLGGWLAI